MKFRLIIILFSIPLSIFAKNVINSGHQSPVKFIEYLETEKSFFSLSEDGTMVIKNIDEEKISKRFFLTSNNISKLVLSPTRDRFAIVESESSSKYIVSLWDWKLEKKLYSINLDEFPMTMGFSGGGNYIYVSSISSQPVKVFNSTTGASTQYLNKNLSYIDYIYIGSSEKTAYLYSSSSGILDIRYLKDSKLIKSIKTEKNLTKITITTDKKFLVGQKENTIYLIGRNDGKVYEKKEIQDLSFYTMNNETGEILCYKNNKYKKSIMTLQIIDGYLFESNIPDFLVKGALDIFCATTNFLVYSNSKGDIESYDLWNNKYSPFVTNNLINIEDITIIEDTAVLTTSDIIVVFKSPFFSDKMKNSKRLTNFNISKYDSPIDNPTGSKNLNGNLLLWKKNLVLFDIKSGNIIFNHEFSSEIVDIKVKDSKLIALDKNGIVKIIDLETNNVTFSFKSPGFTSIGFYQENSIIGGIDKSHGGSLMTLDLTTKETLPIKTSLDVVFNIIESDKSYIIYLTGLKNIGGSNSTYIIEFNLLTKRESQLLKISSEELYSSFDIDENNNIYSNIGTKSLIKLDTKNRQIKPFQTTTNQTNHILYENGGIYTINENRSLSIWNPSTTKKIIDFYLFKDSEWVAITPDSITAFGSLDSEKYINSN